MRFVIALGCAAMIGCSLIVDLSTLSSDAAAPVDASDAALPGDAGDDGYFFDDFDREGGGPIGNGWIEKDPNSWAFTNGTVVRMPDGLNYQNAVVYRPSNEDIGDVAISVEFVANVAPPGFPQLHARVQATSVGIPGSLDAYILAINGSTTGARLDQQHGASDLQTLFNFTLTPAIVAGDRYRLHLSVAHAPAMLVASVEHFDATAQTWAMIGQGSTLDSTDASIDTPGSVGFSGGIGDVDAGYAYDNFTRQAL